MLARIRGVVKDFWQRCRNQSRTKPTRSPPGAYRRPAPPRGGIQYSLRRCGSPPPPPAGVFA
nr:MAG TPA: hypothetical protein [Caudoviricetes sp.]